MIKANIAKDMSCIEITAPKEAGPALGRVPGIKRQRQKDTWAAPLYPESVYHLLKCRAQIAPALMSYIRNAEKVHTYVVRQKAEETAPKPIRPVPVKPGITLYKHQVRAYNIAIALLEYAHGVSTDDAHTQYLARGACALLMDMGTGKSLVSIAVMGRLYMDGRIRRVLVVAPSSVCPVWESELEKFAAFPYRVALLAGTAAQRKKRLSALGFTGGDHLLVAVINYESAWRLEEEISRFAPDMIICDESQRIKNHAAKQSKALHRLGDKAGYRMILTGTPIQKNTLDVWSQYRFLEPAVFPYSFYQFQAHFATMGGFRCKQYLQPRNNAELTEKIHRIAFRIRKEECLDLPEKMFEDRPTPMSDQGMRLYKTLQKEAIAELDGMEITAQHVLTRMLRLQQLTGGFVTGDDGQVVQADTAKLDALKDIIETLCIDEGGKLVVFTRFLAETDAIERMASAILNKNRLGLVRIDGSVSIKARGGIVSRFQNDPGCRLFLGVIDACAEGLTLTAARTAVYYSHTWNYAKYDQSLARIHRIGQTGACTYIHLVAPGTIDTKILRALETKQDLARSVVDNWRQLLEE